LLDISVEHPSLDEVFLGYYDDSGATRPAPDPRVPPAAEADGRRP
jgi:hypothetical protein